MDIEKKDIITLSDNNDYVVISKINYEENYYYYIVDINNVENLKFVKESNDELLELNDKNLLTTLIPLFAKDAINVKENQ